MASFFLGNNIDVDSHRRVTLHSRAYLRRMTDRFLNSPDQCRATPTPSDRHIVTNYEEELMERGGAASTSSSAALRKSYPSKVGALIYCVPASRVDCAHAIGMLARCLTFPTPSMDAAADRCLAYLRQHEDAGITYDASCAHPELHAYSDSDWAVGHSTSGWAILYCGAAVGYLWQQAPAVHCSVVD